MEHPDRGRRQKIRSVAMVRAFYEQFELFTSIPGRESLIIDTTHMAPTEVAEAIAQHYRLATKDCR